MANVVSKLTEQLIGRGCSVHKFRTRQAIDVRAEAPPAVVAEGRQHSAGISAKFYERKDREKTVREWSMCVANVT